MVKKANLAKGFTLPTPAPRTPVPEAAARKFEKAAPTTPADSKLRAPETGVRLVFYLPPDVAQALRDKCHEDRRSKSNAATEALRAWLGLSPPMGT